MLASAKHEGFTVLHVPMSLSVIPATASNPDPKSTKPTRSTLDSPRRSLQTESAQRPHRESR